MRPNKSRSIVIGFLIIVALGFFVWFLLHKSSPVTEIKPKPAPEFVLKNYSGQDVKLSDFRGKPLLINAWASWCPFCKDELLDFAAIKKEFGGKLEIIAIDRAESLEVVKRYSDALGVTDKFIFLLDPDDSFYKAIGGFSMPETIFVNKDGQIVFHKRGPMKLGEIKRRVQDSLGL